MRFISNQTLVLGGLYCVPAALSFVWKTPAGEMFLTVLDCFFLLCLFLLACQEKLRFLTFLQNKTPWLTYYLSAIGWVPYAFMLAFVGLIASELVIPYTEQGVDRILARMVKAAPVLVGVSLFVAFARASFKQSKKGVRWARYGVALGVLVATIGGVWWHVTHPCDYPNSIEKLKSE